MFYPEIIESYQEAIEVAENEYGIQLASSSRALTQLEEILTQDIQIRQESPENRIDPDKRSRLWGAYLGETIRCVLGGYWLAEEDNMSLSVFQRVINPVNYIQERFSGADEISVCGYYMDLLVNIQGKLSRGVAEPG